MNGTCIVTRIIENAEEFRELESAWAELLQRSRSDVLFLTWEWLYTWWEVFGGERKLVLVVVYQGDRLVGIAPFMERERQWQRLVPYRAMEFIGSGSVGSDYLDVIVDSSLEAEVLSALVAVMEKSAMVMELSHIHCSGALIYRLVRRLERCGWHVRTTVCDVAPRILLEGYTWDAFLGSLGNSRKSRFRRKERRFCRAGLPRLQRVAKECERQEALQTLFLLHHGRWSERGGSSAFHSARLLEFHERFSRIALARGWLRLSVLYTDERPAAAVYAFRYGDRFYYYQAGFDPALGSLSPGVILQGISIQQALEEGAVLYDFLRGSESYKYFWSNDQWDLSRVDVFPPHARGMLCEHSLRWRNRVKHLAHRSMPRPVRTRLLSDHH